ncbi:MAG: rhodanese-like domain-containing protein [Methylotenera sp.]|nr:rhodanese-like domain-containing protein [Oligoflexia bacterium]
MQTIVDVREKDEFEAEHIENSVHIPLSEFQTRAPALLKQFVDQDVILMCLSGKRSRLALDEAKVLGLNAPSCRSSKGESWSGSGRTCPRLRSRRLVYRS